MVISLSQITGKDAQLALIWRLATMRNSKLGTVNKRNVLQHDVRSSCKAIVSMIEKSQANRELLSLYIMAQLVYGTTILFSRQVEYLFIDANELVAAVRNHYLVLMPKKEAKKRKGKNGEENDGDFQTPRKRSKKKITDDDLDIDSSPKLLHSQARPDLITLREQLPVASNLFDVNLVDDLVPLSDADFNNMYQTMSQTFTDLQKSSGTGENNPIEEIRNANSFLDENLLAIQPPDTEFLQQANTTPVKNRSDDGRMVPAPGLEDILSMGFENFRKPNSNSNDSMDLDEELEHLKQAAMNHPIQDMPFIPPSTPEIAARPASFELSDLTPSEMMKQTPMRTPAKRRKCGDTQITHTEMREMQNNYDSLLQTSEKYRIKIKKPYELSLKELMDPRPIVNKKNTLPPEIAEMYRSALEKMAKFDPNMGTWIHDKDESDDEDGEISTGRSRQNLPMVELDMENLKFLATPIKVQQTPPATPRRNANDLQLDEIPRISPLSATPIRSIPDVDYENQTRLSDSLSKIQSPLNSQPYQGPSPNDIPGSEIREKILKACENRAPYPAGLDDVLNFDDGKRIAARTFYVLLEMTKERIVKVHEQEKPFSTIKFNLRTEDTEDEDIEDIVSSQENNNAFIASSENT